MPETNGQQQGTPIDGGTVVTAENVGPMIDQILAARAAASAGPTDADKAAFVAGLPPLDEIPAASAARLGDDPARWPADATRIRLQARFDAGRASPSECALLGLMNAPPPDRRIGAA